MDSSCCLSGVFHPLHRRSILLGAIPAQPSLLPGRIPGGNLHAFLGKKRSRPSPSASVSSRVCPQLYTLIPWKSSVDYNVLASEVCLTAVDMVAKPDSDFRRGASDEIAPQVARSVCHERPNRWSGMAQARLIQTGAVVSSALNGTCYRALNATRLRQQQCAPCMACFTHQCDDGYDDYAFLNASLWDMPAPGLNNTNSTLLGTQYVPEQYRQCRACTPAHSVQLDCYEACAELAVGGGYINFGQEQVDRAMNAKAQQWHNEDQCMSADDMQEMRYILDGVANSVGNLQYLVGAEVAVDAASTLLPAAFALASGALRGTKIAKKLAPHSRVPGYLIVAVTVFLMPFVCVVVAVVAQSVADGWAFAGLNLYLLTYAVHIAVGPLVIPPCSHEEAGERLSRVNLVVKLLQLSAMVCIIVAISQQWELVQPYVTDPWFIIRKLCDIFGKRMLVVLCMTDALMDVIVAIHEGV